MDTNDDMSRPLFSLTVGEFLEILKSVEAPPVVDFTQKSDQYVYGIAGLARLLGCSTTTAQTIKNSGRLDKAIQQFGRKIVVNADLAIQLVGKK